MLKEKTAPPPGPQRAGQPGGGRAGSLSGQAFAPRRAAAALRPQAGKYQKDSGKAPPNLRRRPFLPLLPPAPSGAAPHLGGGGCRATVMPLVTPAAAPARRTPKRPAAAPPPAARKKPHRPAVTVASGPTAAAQKAGNRRPGAMPAPKAKGAKPSPHFSGMARQASRGMPLAWRARRGGRLMARAAGKRGPAQMLWRPHEFAWVCTGSRPRAGYAGGHRLPPAKPGRQRPKSRLA